MTVCTWTIVTNTRTLTITGEGSPVIVGGNARCVGIFGTNIQVIKLSGEADGFCSFTSEQIVSTSFTDCQGINPNQRFDCLNGGCIPQVRPDTPGFYSNLAACQAGCAKNSTCKGECWSSEQTAAVQQALDQLKSKIC